MAEYKIEVIPNEQTPKIEKRHDIIDVYIINQHDELLAFLEYAKTRKDGVGLAANQVAINENRFMCRAFALRNLINHSWQLIIDPVITEYIGIKEEKAEGCLTWKGKTIIAERSRAVKVSYYDIDGNYHENEFYKGFEAQIWQHEINHLNGVEEDVREFTHYLPPKSYDRNEPCPCGSGKKYKKCCFLLI